MFEDFKDVISKASSKGDVAVVLIAGTTGFLIDAGLNAIGFLQPGAVGITFASGALGIKRGIEAMTEKKRAKKIEKQEQDNDKKQMEDKVENLKKLLHKLNDNDPQETLDKDLELYNLGLLAKDEFETSLSQIVERIRNRNKI